MIFYFWKFAFFAQLTGHEVVGYGTLLYFFFFAPKSFCSSLFKLNLFLDMRKYT